MALFMPENCYATLSFLINTVTLGRKTLQSFKDDSWWSRIE